MNKMSLLLAVLSMLSVASTVYACDPCALYNASRLQGHSEGDFSISISEQYTDYDLAQDTNENSIRDGELVRGFSTTQFVFNYDATEALGLQVSLPMIGRRYDQIQQYRVDTESEVELGDIVLSGTYSFLNYRKTDWVAISGLTFGLKLPTGDTGVLDDTTEENDVQENIILKHHTIGTGSGGRALTFGTGSYDYILGNNSLLRYERYLLLTNLQYTFRTEGDYDYRFANDLIFSASPGYYIMLDHDFTLAAAVSLSGEFKGKDTQYGNKVTGSAYSNLYLGPTFFITSDDKIGLELGMDFRVTGEDANAVVVPEKRLKANVSYRFS